MATGSSAGKENALVDPSKPFKDVVTEIASKVAELGGVHRYDLTQNVTHLIVGEYDTPKYRHVARERPEILPMDAQWIEAVSELWKNDDDIDFAALEAEYKLKTFETGGVEPATQSGEMRARESLLICLTGFGSQRDELAELIKSHGGRYTGDLTKRCTHLIVNKPEGKKFLAARSWDIYAVSLEWLTMSTERGMILEEAKFDPMLPREEIGKGALKIRESATGESHGKRPRSAISNGPEEGPRKLRKSASMKLSSQRNNIWGDILGRSMSREYSFAEEHRPAEQTTAVQQQQHDQEDQPPTAPPALPITENRGIFHNCVFCAHGFNEARTRVLADSVTSLGAIIVGTIDEAARYTASSDPSHRFLIVPQTSQPDTHPQIDHENMHIVTEFYIEKCLHNKRFFDPNEHVLGRPFPLFPIPGFEDLTIGKAAFTGIELSQVARAIAQLGAQFTDDLRKTTSVLVCKSLQSIRKHKLQWALTWGIPVVSEDWLWECISTGFKVPVENFIFPELKNRYRLEAATTMQARKEGDRQKSCGDGAGPVVPKPLSHLNRSLGAGLDASAFKEDLPTKPKTNIATEESITMADFSTAQTHLAASVTEKQLASEPSTTGHVGNTKAAPLTRSSGPQRILSEPTTLAGGPTRVEAVSERAPSAPPIQVEDPASDADQRCQKDAEEIKLAKAAEREQLTSKITSLIHSTTGSGGSLDAEASSGAPRARRRRIFGRAISNTSNASSGASVETSKVVPEAFRVGEIADSEDEASQPPATQLGYDYPEAQEYKAALLSRTNSVMAEAKADPASTATTSLVGGGRSLRRRL